ncbi:scopoletin glucosyltransferase-like [Eucalyptus grandis]|uniref:scopoletin glucosyltransferase-like n=1 Tax=Eucalyptus grandis TaxID=71139 RepID=UPI00192ED339|nr:scopoletin glucosyltransferase-like [Eucalyptus grandis]
MDGKGLIIRGWAPQLLILDHESIGGFVTHCGWNSTLESISAGVPMVTWPMFADQFYNENLVVQVLGIGASIGSKSFAMFGEGADLVNRDDIDKVVRRVMAGEEAEVMRRRAKVIREMARKAVAEGGSSDSDLTSLIEELMQHKAAREYK